MPNTRKSQPLPWFENETDVKTAFADGKLNRDVAVVVRNQGPQSNGMPELHSLTPVLSNIQDQGHTVMLITDGRMSGASGRVPAAIHVTPKPRMVALSAKSKMVISSLLMRQVVC